MQIQVSGRNRKTVLPIRLQAYERLALLLERISPESIIMRVNKPGMTAKQLHSELLSSIRAEFDHNISQQVYISNEAWEHVTSARGKVIHLINTAADQVKDEATALILSQQIYEMTMEVKPQPHEGRQVPRQQDQVAQATTKLRRTQLLGRAMLALVMPLCRIATCQKHAAPCSHPVEGFLFLEA